MSFDSEQQYWNEQLAVWARNKPTIAELWIFGSRARGDHKPESDLDVAVIMAETSGKSRYANWFFSCDDWRAELSSLLPVSIDLDIGDADISTKIAAPALKREGVRVYCRQEEEL